MEDRKFETCLESMFELLSVEHGGCEDNTCSVSVALRMGYKAHAVECFLGSGAASQALEDLAAPYRKALERASRREAAAMVKGVPHEQCPKCGAVIWMPEELGDAGWDLLGSLSCPNCRAYSTSLERKEYEHGIKLASYAPGSGLIDFVFHDKDRKASHIRPTMQDALAYFRREGITDLNLGIIEGRPQAWETVERIAPDKVIFRGRVYRYEMNDLARYGGLRVWAFDEDNLDASPWRETHNVSTISAIKGWMTHVEKGGAK